MVIRSVKHSLKFMNTEKMYNYASVFQLMCDTQDEILNRCWNTPIDITTKENHYYFDIQKNILNIPAQLPSTIFNNDKLYSRLVNSITNDTMDILRSRTEQRRKQLYILKKLQKEKKECSKLQSYIDRNPLTQPVIKNHTFELSSKNIEFIPTTGEFDYFIRFHSLSEDFEDIYIPIKKTAMDNKFIDDGFELCGGILLSATGIEFRYKKDIPLKTEGIKIGVDPGIKTLLSVSDSKGNNRQSTVLNIENVLEKLCRKKKGSKGYKRAQQERTQLLRLASKEIDLDNVMQMGYEFFNLTGSNSSAKIKKWAYGLLKDIEEQRCEMAGVQFILQDCPYMSQRCQCGWVDKRNRKGKIFQCHKCGHTDDADFNSSTNHAGQENIFDLTDWSPLIRKYKLNSKGFYWYANGIYDEDGCCLIETIRSLESRIPLNV